MKACLGYPSLVRERQVGGLLIHSLDHRRGQRGQRVRMCGSQAHATGREGHWRLQSLVTGSHGVTGSRSHLGAHCPATPQSWMGRLPAARSSFPATSRPQSAEGVGRRSISFCPKGLSRNRTLGSAPILADDHLHSCCLGFPCLRPSPTPSLLPPPLSRRRAPSSPPNPLITYPLPPLSLPLSPQLAASAHLPAPGCS